MEIIKEAMDKLYADYCEKNKNTIFYGFRSARYHHFRAGFDASTQHFFSLPLAQRLTESERIEILRLYFDAADGASEYSHGYYAALKRIFGDGLLTSIKSK